MRNVVPRPGVLLTVISPPIRSVSILLIVRPSPVPPAGSLAAIAPRANGSKIVFELIGRDAGPGVLDLEERHLARVAQPKVDAAVARELDRVAQHVDEDLSQALLVGAHHLRNHAAVCMRERDALARRLQLEHARDLLHAFLEAHRLHVERQLAAFDARDVERALDQRQQVVAAAQDDAAPPACGAAATRRPRRAVAHSRGCC